jgi:hypothetical protein
VLQPDAAVVDWADFVRHWTHYASGAAWRRMQAELALRGSRRSLRAGRGHSTMRTNPYWLDDVWRAFAAAGFADVGLRMIRVRSNGYGRQFWLARTT